MSDDLDWLTEEAPVEAKAELVRSPTGRVLSKAEQVSEELRGMEDRMLKASLSVVGGAIDFTHLDPSDPKMPEGWVEELGFEEATLRHRAALAGLMSAKEAPVGIKLAAQMVTGIVKARSSENAGMRDLNIGTVVFMGKTEGTPEEYVELEVEE